MLEGKWGLSNLAGFVLCDLMLSVLLAVLAFAIGAACFGDVDLIRYANQLDGRTYQMLERKNECHRMEAVMVIIVAPG